MQLLHGRRGLVVGIANERSMAHGIAKAAAEAGARLALTYQDERLATRVREIGSTLPAEHVLPCDVTRDSDITTLATALTTKWGGLDFLVHAVASAKREELGGRFVDTSRDGFAMALDVSVYSLVALVRAVEPLLSPGASILTLTYYGGEKVVPNYNVMGVAKAALDAAVRYLAADLGPKGVRVNALSPGPVKTLSAAAIPGLRAMLAFTEQVAPLRRNIGIEDVGRAALFLLSDLSSATTGEVVHVDAGYHLLGAPALTEPSR